MFHNVSKRIIEYTVKNDSLDDEKAEEYIYGLELSLTLALNYISILIIGFLMGMLWQAVLFLFIYTSIRRFAGGFHFNSSVICYLSMCIMCILTLLIIKYSVNNVWLYSSVMAVSTLIILIISPVSAVNKPLDEKEKIVFGRISRAMVIIMAVIYSALCIFGQIYIAKIIAITMFYIAIFAILGKIKFNLYKKAAS